MLEYGLEALIAVLSCLTGMVLVILWVKVVNGLLRQYEAESSDHE